MSTPVPSLPNDRPPLIGVATVTYNSAEFLDDFVASCSHQTLDRFRVYCVDNKSTDGTTAALRRVNDPRWRITFSEQNLGFAGGSNLGIQQALADGCEWVLLLNNDTLFSPDHFDSLWRACQANAWQVVVPKIHFDQPAGCIWYAGGGFNAWRGHTGYHQAIGEPDVGQLDAPGTVDFAPACSMLVHRSVFETVGLLDEAFFVYFEDTDYCQRLRAAGIHIGYWPRAMLVHKVGGSTGGVHSSFTARITARNRLFYLRKHFGEWAPLLWTPVFLAFYVGRFLLRRWNPTGFLASLQGSFSYRSMRPQVPALESRPPPP